MKSLPASPAWGRRQRQDQRSTSPPTKHPPPISQSTLYHQDDHIQRHYDPSRVLTHLILPSNSSDNRNHQSFYIPDGRFQSIGVRSSSGDRNYAQQADSLFRDRGNLPRPTSTMPQSTFSAPWRHHQLQPPPPQLKKSTTQALPFLTMALLHLEKILPEFIRFLLEPTAESATKACALLEFQPHQRPSIQHHSDDGGRLLSQSSTPPASTSSSKWPASTQYKHRPNHQFSSSPSSPVSPVFFQWFSPHHQRARPAAQSSPTLSSSWATTHRMQQEWDTLAARPLMLLAAVYVLTADLYHLTPPSTSTATSSDTSSATTTTTLPHLSQLSHPGQSTTPRTPLLILLGLWKRCIPELLQMQQTLCDPFLRQDAVLASSSSASKEPGDISEPAIESPVEHAEMGEPSSLVRSATYVAETIQGWSNLIIVQCQLLEWQAQMFSVTAPVEDYENFTSWASALAGLDVLLHQLLPSVSTPTATLTSPSHESCQAMNSLRSLLVREIRSWRACLEASRVLEQCQFLETIVHLRKWKNFLPLHGTTTRVSIWFQHTYAAILSLLPIYFDATCTFAGPLYGFNLSAVRQGCSPPSRDWDAVMIDLLKRQEKVGGPPTAVALVLDASSTANFYPERGFSMEKEDKSSTKSPSRALWPAVYLRSTLHLLASSSNAGTGRAYVTTTTATNLLRSPQPSLLNPWSSASLDGAVNPVSSSPKFKSLQKLPSLQFTLSMRDHVLEYGPDEGKAASWPHDEWEGLSAILEARRSTSRLDDAAISLGKPSLVQVPIESHSIAVEDPLAVTYHEDDDAAFDLNETHSVRIDDATNFFRMISSQLPESHTRVSKLSSTFHVASLSNWLSLVVMVKTEDEGGRWQRRRSRLGDSEIRAFMNEIAAGLRISSRFSISQLPDSQLSAVRPRLRLLSAMEILQDSTWSDEKDILIFLGYLKESFGVHTSRHSARNGMLNKGSSLLFRQKSSSPAEFKLLNGAGDHSFSISAAVYFLGADLVHLIQDDTS